MFDLESVAHRLTNNLLADSQLNSVEKAKVEYGASLLLGMLFEFVLTVGVSLFFGTAGYTVFIMLSALTLRLFTGGAHCTSFLRCSIFTLVIFIAVSLLVKAMVINVNYEYIMWISLVFLLITFYLIWKPNRRIFAIWATCLVLPILGIFSSNEKAWWAILTLSTVVGLALQAFMMNTFGKKLVLASDKIMLRLGI